MDKPLVAEFGETLKNLRNEKGFSQEELAFRADLDRTYVSMLERGIRRPSLTTVFQLSTALGIDASMLIAKIEAVKKTTSSRAGDFTHLSAAESAADSSSSRRKRRPNR